MNEHDSERISGLLEADGMTRVDDEADADVIVLNTCCIRENADNKLYGALGHLKALKDARPDVQIAVGGCLAQKDRERILERAGHVDVVFGTHNVHRAVELLDHAAGHGPIVEVLEAAARDDEAAFPSALPTRREVDHAAWVTIQIGCDNTCAFCIVPSVRGPEISRPFGDLVTEIERLADDGVTEITLLGQNVNSYGRDLTLSRRENPSGDDEHWCGAAWLGDRRPRPLFADLVRSAVRWRASGGFVSPALTPRTCEPTCSARWPRPPRQRAPPLPAPVGQRPGPRRDASGLHRRAVSGPARRSPPPSPTSRCRPTSSSDFPGRPTTTSPATLEVAAEAAFDSAFTFIFSPRPGTEAATMTDGFVDHDVAVARYERLRVVIERSSLAANERRVGRVEEVTIEGPSKKDPQMLTGRTRRNTLVHFPSPSPLRAGTYAEIEVVEGRSTHLRGRLLEVRGLPGIAPDSGQRRLSMAEAPFSVGSGVRAVVGDEIEPIGVDDGVTLLRPAGGADLLVRHGAGTGPVGCWTRPTGCGGWAVADHPRAWSRPTAVTTARRPSLSSSTPGQSAPDRGTRWAPMRSSTPWAPPLRDLHGLPTGQCPFVSDVDAVRDRIERRLVAGEIETAAAGPYAGRTAAELVALADEALAVTGDHPTPVFVQRRAVVGTGVDWRRTGTSSSPAGPMGDWGIDISTSPRRRPSSSGSTVRRWWRR
ncbi:MAG: TRAM domain-containing protein [Acidimicrobiales bacterium]